MDVRAARQDPEAFRAAVARKGGAASFDALLAADEAWRQVTSVVEGLRARTKLKGKPDAAQLQELAEVKAQLRVAEEELEQRRAERDRFLGLVPNPPDASVPDGGEDEGTVVRLVGERPSFDFPVRDHLALGGFDVERGARLSGSRFAYRVGAVALVELALYRMALDRVVRAGFVPMLPPVLVREEAMYGTGFLPTEESNLYRVEPDGLYLTGTSEVALAGYHQGEILLGEDLPLRYAGYSTNFRREAGAAGRDTRGVFRVHQFDKVEMFVWTLPECSVDEHEALLAIEEGLARDLGLTYRVVNIAAGDLGAPAAKKYDIEAWIPSQERYREISSCSNTTDYQARRLGTRVRENKELRHPHTLNGTAMTARWLIALLETFQDLNGAVAIPDALVALGAPSRLEVAAS
ncbi:MAG: serine--tRNA ligase [Actinomycetota bacterium]|nr:serine--tRNA ligase [Actinomycetota bacterium]